ncbi:MAG: DEAD/DEAH box helicase, partial [Bryobacteraceae bacterium]
MSLESAKGAARTTIGVRNYFASHSVLREFLKTFDPLISEWFENRFGSVTDAQRLGWPQIRSGHDVLISAPTGSGKTLAAFLICLDALVKAARAGPLAAQTQVLYISPLKALSVDVHKNLEIPLAEISALAAAQGIALAPISSAVRTGDTPSRDRQRMGRTPPHILVTTPESFYILLTAERPREMLRTVRTVIVDEIHAVADDKRGSHLALSLARLDRLTGVRAQRIGLSATVAPIEEVAHFLGDDVRVVQVGHRRAMDLGVEVPRDELGAVASNEMWDEIYDRLAELIAAHRTTLVFVNTRRLSERVAHHLAQRLGEGAVLPHHGSLNATLRHEAEARLKAGDLRAVVATASLELGIDIGSADLVCQIGSPRSIAVALQRVGRSGHGVHALPKGRLFATSRDELIECAALVRAIRAGLLDRLEIPEAPLDILAQQIVAACAAEEFGEAQRVRSAPPSGAETISGRTPFCASFGEAQRVRSAPSSGAETISSRTPFCASFGEDELFALVRRAYPYRRLERSAFDAVVEMLSDGITTARGRSGALLHRDQVNGRLRGRRGARLAAITSGGAIPDSANYYVVAEPEGVTVGTLDEDFAVESLAGDIFLLGTTSWRIRRVEPGRVRVEDAHGAAPSIPFWRGEAPGRTAELSSEVSRLREEIAQRGDAVEFLERECGLDRRGAEQAVEYVRCGVAMLGVVPSVHTVVAERFFDEAGGMQLVIHSPFGARINRAWGLALRKRFCRTFNFELQAAATDNGIVISLAEQHSFPLDMVFGFLHAETVQPVLVQALLDSPMFTVRWRWNAARALAIPRFSGGRKVPAPIQRMRSDDLLAGVFPDQAACGENLTGDIRIPDHPLVTETIANCLHEAMDLNGLRAVLDGISSGAIRTVAVERPEPSVFSHEILNANPYAYLDDAPLEERRALAVQLRRTLGVEDAAGIGALDATAIAQVIDEARPPVRDPDELHDFLLTNIVLPPEPAWQPFFETLRSMRRAMTITAGDTLLWTAAERQSIARAAYPENGAALESSSVVAILRGCLESCGPVTETELSARLALPRDAIAQALAQIEAEGQILRGHFRPPGPAPEIEWCNRRLLARIHRLTIGRLRREIEPVTSAEFLRFLARWQHAAPGTQLHGVDGLLEVIRQLQGYEIPAAAWEAEILPRRVARYDAELLDRLCLSGEVTWGRLSPHPAFEREDARRVRPTRVAPLAIFLREDAPWLMAGRAKEAPALSHPAREVLAEMERRGASFFNDLTRATSRLASEVEDALW